MSETEIVEYLLRCILEFGVSSTGSERKNNVWYEQSDCPGVFHPIVKEYFDYPAKLNSELRATINEKGLALIRNYHERNGDR